MVTRNESREQNKIERITGQIEGLSFCIENKEISGALLDIAETIDSVIKSESEDGGNNNG